MSVLHARQSMDFLALLVPLYLFAVSQSVKQACLPSQKIKGNNGALGPGRRRAALIVCPRAAHECIARPAVRVCNMYRTARVGWPGPRV